MTGTKVPLRRCVGCRRVRPVSELRRFVRSEDGQVMAGERAPGRGAWLCSSSPDCLHKATANRGFDRAFRAPCDVQSISRLSTEE